MVPSKESSKIDHEVLIVPGLGDRTNWLEWMARDWAQKYGINLQPHVMPWSGNEQTFQPKLERFLTRIDSLTKEGRRVSLIGTSAGGSAVINAFTQRQNDLHKVVNVCGRLRTGGVAYPPLEHVAEKHPAFMESLYMLEEAEKSLDYDARQNILTVRPLFDEVVPVSTMTVEGACNVQIISVEHMINIATAMTIYSGNITKHLLSEG